MKIKNENNGRTLSVFNFVLIYYYCIIQQQCTYPHFHGPIHLHIRYTCIAIPSPTEAEEVPASPVHTTTTSPATHQLQTQAQAGQGICVNITYAMWII